MGNLFHSIRSWWGEAIEHAFGDPRQEKLHQPPLIGTQPFRVTPVKRARD